MLSYLYGEEIDRRLNWPLGRAERMARRAKLPHIVLPDGAIRFDWQAVEKMLRHVQGPEPVNRQGVARA
jgi:hypothetical protein